MPVELFPLAAPHGALRYGIVSGYRRLAAFRELHAFGLEAYAAIPAFVRPATGFAATLAAMVEENAIRADLSPWEQGRIAVLARDQERLPHHRGSRRPALPRGQRRQARAPPRRRPRSSISSSTSSPPPKSSPSAGSCASAPPSATASARSSRPPSARPSLRDPDSQWAAILPYLIESERQHSFTDPDPEPRRPRPPRPPPPHRPPPRRSLVIRREMARDGYILRFTGKEATSSLMDEVLDEIEMIFTPR